MGTIKAIGNKKAGRMMGLFMCFHGLIARDIIKRCKARPNGCGGVAFGGPETIQEVQLSFDLEKTWVSAELETPLSPYTWVIWNYDWVAPKAGKHMVFVRAIDAKGKVQTSEMTRPQPAGATGLHSIILDVMTV